LLGVATGIVVVFLLWGATG